MTIDMHAHWRPSVLIEALRSRKTEPMIIRNEDGEEVLKTRRGEEPIAKAFDDMEQRLAEMDRLGISTGVLSLVGSFTWIERLPVQESLPLVRLVNDSVSALCKTHEGRFAGFASLPMDNIAAAAEEFERAMALPGMVGTQVPGNAFLTYKDAEQIRPILEVANRHKAVVFIHFGPRPGDDWPRVPGDADNVRRRMGTLDMQASLSSNMVTLCMTDILDDYPDAIIQVHNLGGNIPYEMERMDHRSLLDTPDEELPSKRFANSRVYVDCNSFGPHAIEAGLRAYGPDRIVFGTDGTEFGVEWSTKAVNDADISDEERRKIMHQNAANMLSHLAPIADYGVAAE
ncbi:MAG: amidohydrolase family protein [Rhodospirillaceae bacterium]|jgi:predicted TIM-barrel fold metal-dependent hydrolase|nr:amidohydrolase family protein [Rhodospirillaceae bacterium]MBT5458520.1 amidohydrolase family protein [Rhodospirillaceae bacterium]